MTAKTRESRLHSRGDSLGPGESSEASSSTVVTIQPGSQSKPPLFCVHAEAGDVSLYYGIARHLPPDQPVLGLCAPPTGERWAGEYETSEHGTSKHGTNERLERMAEHHACSIRGVQPNGPWLIVGECTGGALAYEIARQLRTADREIALLALVDAFPRGLPPLRRHMPRLLYRMLHRARILGFHCANLIRLGTSEKLAYVSSKAKRARQALTAKASTVLSRSVAGASPRVAFREALAAYEPGSYAGSVVLFRAAELPLGIQTTPDLGWADFVGNLEVETVPGYFTTLVSEPTVQILAGKLSRRLSESASAS